MSTPWPLRCRLGDTPGLNPFVWSDAGPIRDSVTITRGRSDELTDDETGTCNLTLDNRDGRFTPGIDPHTGIRVEVDHNGTWRPIFTGLVESAPAGWAPSGKDATVAVSAVDGLSWLARIDVTVQLDAQDSGARINAVLDAAGWPSSLRDIDAGLVEVVALDDDGDEITVKALDAIRDAVEAEQGQIFIGPDGTFTFRDRHARLDAAPAATFGTSHPMVDLQPTFDDFKLFTVGRAEMADGETVEFTADTIGTYGRRLFEVRDLATSLIEGEAVAAWMVVRYDAPTVRFARLGIEGRHDGVLDLALDLEPGVLVGAVHAPAVGSSVDELVHVERVSHRITLQPLSWRTTCELSPYFGAGPWLELDSSDPVMVLDGTAKLAP